METAITTPATDYTTETIKNNTWHELLAMVDNQAEHKTVWYLFSLVLQGVVFLPIPAVLMYYYHASILVLPVTFGLYLCSIIVGMGGYGIRAVIGFFMLCIIVNLAMLAFYIL
jgi:hypothetical protein